ncbi:hypothetical protein MTR_5g038035 [Medicago truncatula]|uniref:Uncharacterized protein n=1 Tax=Medicago truncatula TaxID=3880 RepID=A0A072UDC5_MEDTR|nr:hypothetical protein MTR_5g038035 [Medicago truncatula]
MILKQVPRKVDRNSMPPKKNQNSHAPKLLACQHKSYLPKKHEKTKAADSNRNNYSNGYKGPKEQCNGIWKPGWQIASHFQSKGASTHEYGPAQ